MTDWNKTEKALERFVMVFFFVVSALLAAGILCMLVSGCDDVSQLDEGALLADDGEELQAPPWPITVGYDGSITREKLAGIVEEGPTWWNDQIGEKAVEGLGEDDSAFMVFDVNGLPLAGADVLDLQDEVELTQVRYDLHTYAIIGCRATLNYDVAYDEETMRVGVRHAIGHCLGLADDPGPPVTVDLRSIMAKPMDVWGELTAHDKALLLGGE